MDGATIAMFVFQTVITAIIGVAAWGVKNAIGEIKGAITELKAQDKENADEIAKVRGELNDLKQNAPDVKNLLWLSLSACREQPQRHNAADVKIIFRAWKQPQRQNVAHVNVSFR